MTQKNVDEVFFFCVCLFKAKFGSLYAFDLYRIEMRWRFIPMPSCDLIRLYAFRMVFLLDLWRFSESMLIAITLEFVANVG